MTAGPASPDHQPYRNSSAPRRVLANRRNDLDRGPALGRRGHVGGPVAQDVAGILAIVLFFCAGAYTITTLARLFVQWRMHARSGGVDSVALEERLTRLEAAVESVTAETQRLIEGQRFFADLLRDRPAPAALVGTASANAFPRNGTA